jgi:hypothetical protein
MVARVEKFTTLYPQLGIEGAACVTKPMHIQQIWVLLLGLPLEFWSKEMPKSIGNSLGRFIFMEDDFLGKMDKRVVRLLAKLDL